MESERKGKGRPPKNGVTEPWRFGRALKVVHAYRKARAGGEKHSAAVREAVEFVRQHDPKMPISETEVKRILAEFLPKDGPAALVVEYATLEGEEAAKLRSLHEQRLANAGIKITGGLSDQNRRKPLKRFKFRFGERPHYPRHNASSTNP